MWQWEVLRVFGRARLDAAILRYLWSTQCQKGRKMWNDASQDVQERWNGRDWEGCKLHKAMTFAATGSLKTFVNKVRDEKQTRLYCLKACRSFYAELAHSVNLCGD